MNNGQQKKVYLYGRLSKDDGITDDSISIKNQQLILERYAEDEGYANYEFVFDDGYKGYDFERPAFMKMIEDVEKGLVSAIIVKDLSRFGRNHVMVGYYTEIYLPSKEVRFVAIQDNVDDAKGENDFAPMVNLFNEWHVRNTSRKIRAVQQAKGKAGQHLSVNPNYGYMKNPDNPKEWIIDEEAAEVVRRIFRMVIEGTSAAEIARILSQEKVLNPSNHKFQKGISSKPRGKKEPWFWNTTVIHKILDTREYLGHTINFKTYSKSYKDRRSRINPVENQLVFENTHPAVIDEEIWEIVSKKRQHKRYIPRYGVTGLFNGIVYCSDCESKLYYSTRKLKTQSGERSEGAYSCSVYRKQTIYRDRKCTAHYITESALTEIVLIELREMLGFVSSYENRFVKLAADKSVKERTALLGLKKQSAVKMQSRISELDGLIEKLYEDNATGKITDERYFKLYPKFEAEQGQLKVKLSALEIELTDLESEGLNIEKFLKTVRKYTKIEELSPAIIAEFIDKIIVHEPEKARGDRKQKVEIIYNKIGTIVLPESDIKIAETQAPKVG